MQPYNSLRSFRPYESDQPGERVVANHQAFPPLAITDSFDDLETEQFAALLTTGHASRDTGPARPTALARPQQNLPAVQTPQSLITALQATMDTKVMRPPLVIPAAMKRTRQLPQTEELALGTRRMHPHLRLSIVFGSLFAVLLFTMLTLSPLVNGQSELPIVSGAINWVQSQQPVMGVISGHVDTNTQQQQQGAQVAQQQPQPGVVTVSVPNSDYVAVARQAALNAGIPPDAFVRQIYKESSFNPNAVSPAGAVGIAQFLPSTAAGLGINPYDPVSALNGAAKYMAGLSSQFGGNYAMALAAYNAGSGAVHDAVNRGGANWLSLLPYETQMYVRQIMG